MDVPPAVAVAAEEASPVVEEGAAEEAGEDVAAVEAAGADSVYGYLRKK